MTLKTKIDERISFLNLQIAQLNALKELIASDFTVETASVSGTGFCYIDIDFPSRADVVNILKVLHVGKWEKSKVSNESEKLNYISPPIIGDVAVRLWAAQPPGSCRIVEETVEVPETVVPAHTKIVKRLVCSEPETEAALVP